MASLMGLIGTLTIPNAGSVPAAGGAIRLSGYDWLGFRLPAAWTAATLAVEFSDLAAPTTADADWLDWNTGSGVPALPAAANTYVATPTGVYIPILAPNMWLRVRSGTRGAPVNQGAQRVISVYGRRFA